MREPKKTIAQLRWEQVEKLATLKNAEPTEEDLRNASRTMNSLYRLCGLVERNFYRSNDVRWNTNKHLIEVLEEDEEREYRWARRLEKTFSEEYGLKLMFPGLYPKLYSEYTGYAEISLYFYD